MTDPERSLAEPGREMSAPTLRVSMVESGARSSLLVNDKKITVADDPELVRRALVEGHSEILTGLERYQEYMKKLNPGATKIGLAPFVVVGLGNMKDGNLTTAGRKQARNQQIFDTPEIMKPNLLPFWQAIIDGGFKPTLRAYWTGEYWIDLWAEIPNPE